MNEYITQEQLIDMLLPHPKSEFELGQNFAIISLLKKLSPSMSSEIPLPISSEIDSIFSIEDYKREIGEFLKNTYNTIIGESLSLSDKEFDDIIVSILFKQKKELVDKINEYTHNYIASCKIVNRIYDKFK